MNNIAVNDVSMNDRVFGEVTFHDRNGKLYINGLLTFRGRRERVHKSTGYNSKEKYTKGVFKGAEKERTVGLREAKSNENYARTNGEAILWELSNHKKKYDYELAQEANNTSPLISDFYQEAFDDKLKLNKISIETYNEYIHKYTAYIAPYFKGVKLNEVTSDDIEKWQMWIAKKFNRKSLRDIRSALNIIYTQARKHKGYIHENPLLNAEHYHTDKEIASRDEDEDITYTDDEMRTILSNVDDYIAATNHTTYVRVRKQLKNMVYLSFGTGIRSGEMVALVWSDINFKKRTISINKTIRKGRVKVTKTSSGKRELDMNDETYQLLQNQKELLKDQDSEMVFLTYQNKNYTDPSEVSKGMWKTYLKFCNIEYRRFYRLRHTFATNIANDKNQLVGIVSLSAQLGHKDVAVTMKKYIKTQKKHVGVFSNISVIQQLQESS